MATIYIVEDDVNIREIERYALKNGGFDVVEFERGSDLSAAVEKKIPSLILLDIMLPDEDGLDIWRHGTDLPCKGITAEDGTCGRSGCDTLWLYQFR